MLLREQNWNWMKTVALGQTVIHTHRSLLRLAVLPRRTGVAGPDCAHLPAGLAPFLASTHRQRGQWVCGLAQPDAPPQLPTCPGKDYPSLHICSL